MKELVGIIIRDYLNDQLGRPNPFSSGVPGEDWWQRFLQRWHSELSFREPQHLPTHRALSATPEVMDGWFKYVQQLFDEAKLSTLSTDELKCYLWNCDETGFCTAMTAKKISAKCGDKNVHETVGESGRDYITILGAGGKQDLDSMVKHLHVLWMKCMKECQKSSGRRRLQPLLRPEESPKKLAKKLGVKHHPRAQMSLSQVLLSTGEQDGTTKWPDVEQQNL